MANIQFQMSPAPGIIQDLICVIYNTLAPVAEVDRQVFTPPHDNPQTVMFSNLPIGTYIVRVHQSPDGVILGNIENDFFVNAAINTTSAYTIKTFQVGLGRSAPYYDPADGDTDYINPDLDGLDYVVFKPGYGPLDWLADITTYPGGGFSFTNNQVFSQDEIYTILISNLVNVASGGTTSQSFPVGTETVNANISFTATQYNKILDVIAPNDILITLPNLATIPDGTKFAVNTHTLFSNDYNSVFRYAIIQLQPGETCTVNNVSLNAIHVGRCEEMTFVKIGGGLRVLSGAEGYRNVGRVVYSFSKGPWSSLLMQGGWYAKTAVGRLFGSYVNLLDPAELGAGTDDVTPSAGNASKWIIGTNKIWIPNHGGFFHRISDGDGDQDHIRRPNEIQGDKVGPGQILSKALTGNGLTKNGIPGGSPGVLFLATLGDGGLIETNTASGTNNNNVRIDPLQIDGGSGLDAQTRPKNVSINAYVLI